MDETEQKTIAAAQAGDAAAIDALVTCYRQPVFRLAYLMLGDADDAHDVTQEAFLRAIKALERFDLNRPIRPWLLSIAANLARNRRRTLGRYWKMVNQYARIIPREKAGPEAQTVAQIEAVDLWQAVKQLKAHHREVVYLRYFMELPVNEVAEVLDVAPGTVRSRQHRALNELRGVIERDFPHLGEDFKQRE